MSERARPQDRGCVCGVKALAVYGGVLKILLALTDAPRDLVLGDRAVRYSTTTDNVSLHYM